MSAVPVEILTGQLSRGEILFGFTVQIAWGTLAFLLYRLIWTRGIRHYEAVGG